MFAYLPDDYSKQAEDLALIYAEAYRQARAKLPGIPSGMQYGK